MIPSAYRRPGGSMVIIITTTVLLLGGLAWTARHLTTMTTLANPHTSQSQFALMWAFVFGALLLHLYGAWTNRPASSHAWQRKLHLTPLKLCVVIPAYNEDPAALTLSIRSLFEQTRLPDIIHIIDDGSTDPQSLELPRHELARYGRLFPSTRVVWTRTSNAGKRHAQAVAFQEHLYTADVFITMDSDTVLDSKCIDEALQPLISPTIMSVAAMTLTYNVNHPLVRLADAWVLAFQFVTRAALSRVGNVLVNSGGFSLYRSQVIQAAMNDGGYLNETFAGRQVMFSDDSMLTLYAKSMGRTVQQDTAVAFTFMPEKVSHHLRQQLRWMRGSTIRSIWRFRYLKINSWGYWENLSNWWTYILVTVAFLALFIYMPLTHGQFIPYLLVFSLAICYMNCARYLTIGRSDQTLGQQLITVALAPVMMAWTAIVLRPLRWYAIATCYRTGWGTRSQVEVSA